MKLISDLKLGDKVFVIDKYKCTFDIAEVVEVSDMLIGLLPYLDNIYNCLLYIWKYPKSKHINHWYIFCTDEIEAVEEFKQLLWQQ